MSKINVDDERQSKIYFEMSQLVHENNYQMDDTLIQTISKKYNKEGDINLINQAKMDVYAEITQRLINIKNSLIEDCNIKDNEIYNLQDEVSRLQQKIASQGSRIPTKWFLGLGLISAGLGAFIGNRHSSVKDKETRRTT